MLNICAYGELLLRINPSHNMPFASLPDSCETYFGGAETNFLVHASNLGEKSSLLTVLPENVIGRAALNFLGKSRVSTRFVKMSRKGRMGIYFLEDGAAQRGSRVTYDRKGSSINRYDFSSLPFRDLFARNSHFHVTGITPALSERTMNTTLRAVRLAKEMGLQVSCDLNFRSQLWKYRVRGVAVNKEEVMSEIVSYCDFLFANEIDIQRFFYDEGVLPEYRYESVDLVYYENMLLRISSRFPGIRYISVSTRKSDSADVNSMGGVLYIREHNQFFFSPNRENRFKPYRIDPVVDRIGSGDAFAAGFVCGMHQYDDPQRALDCAVASSVLKHGYRGDTGYTGIEDIESLIQGSRFGRIRR
jgi:2-dehydro-3-deoxygluconokinase